MTSGTAMRSRVRRRLFESLEPRKMLSATDGDLESIPLPLNAAADEVFGEFGEALIPIDEGKIPLLHSFPEAQTKVFLDFDGNFELSWSDATHVVTPPYDIDGRPDSFGSGEQERIVEIWRRVAEDYAPFQIDVTTEDPSDHVTELNEVDASIKRIRTFYFRREFDITDPADVRNLRVHLLRDDGAAVYLNGTQVVRDNLGLNARFDDFATSGSSGSDEQTYHQFPVDETLLVHGRNVIAVEVHQRSDDSSDTSFDLQLTANVGGQPSSDVIPRQSEWAYLDDGSDQGTAWSSADFNDGNWPVGRGEFGYGDMTATTQVAIGGSSADWYDGQSGGVALLNSFRSGDSAVAFVFSRSLSNVTKRIAEAASHEAGHTFGLTHQATFDESGEKIDDYNRGGNGWAPIMGVAYDEEISTWSNGPTSSVNNTQDNMAVIAQRGGGYRRDDHGDLASNATALTDLIGDNGDFEISGVLERNTDRDAFSFILGETQSGASLTVTGIGIGSGQNLDAVLEIQDASGQIVFVDDPADSYNASISAPLLPGKYTAIVRSNGEYGRVGQYTLSGHIDESTSVVNGFSRVAPLGSTAMATTVDGALDYPDDTDTFVVLGQAGQVLSVIVTPTNPLAVLEANLSSIAEPVASRGPGQPIVIANQLLDGTDLSLDISGTSVGDYTVEFGVNQSFEVTASGIRGSDSRDPATIGQSFSNGTSLWNVSGVSGDGTDTRTSLVPLGATWTYLDDGSNQQKEWRLADFDDSTWQSGAGQFGYGEGDENVRLQQDRITGSRIRTFYFRHEFYVDDASAIRDLTLKLLRDDGAAVYLNGTEVRRDNLVANASFTTFASTAVVEDRFLDSTVDPKLLVDGRNVLAVEVHQASNTSDDLSFALELIANAIPQRASTELIAKQSTWSYLDDGSDQREAWREPEFDDASWAHGAGKLGYGDGDERTRLSSTANGVPTRTFYFRRDFFVADVGAIDELVANINYDDGLAVYVNGIEVARSNLARNAEHQTLADESKTPEGTFDPFVIDPLFLNEGTNTIAVEVHQHDDASSDVSFDLELIAYNAALEVDEYEFDVPVELIGSTIDVALVADQMFAGETLVLFTPTGDLATAKTGSGDAALAISDFLIKEPGTYRLQLLSDVKGDYQITIVSDAVATYMFDELPPLPTADRLVGFLPFGESDVYKFEATAGEHTLSVDFPFDTPDRSTENDLQVSILVFRPDGTILTASNDGTLNVTLEAATYQVEVLAISGSGEYHFTVAGPPAIFASDLNGDGVTTADDIDYLCEAVRSDNRLLDQNGDGQIDFLDVEHFVTKPLGTTFGDANLDGVFNSTDFVAVFDVAEYEDDIDGNSTWAEGDWNCSGDFDTADLVTAFTYAGYSAAASPRTSPVNRDLVAARTLESHDRESDDSNKATTPHQARSVWNVSAKVLQPKSVDAVFLA